MGLGQVVALEHSAALEARSARLSVRGPVVVEGTRTGDSISVNGCCLTVSELSDGVFVADVMAETLQRTGLGALAPGSRVNLERALRPGDRMGGHIVQGHVDTTGTLLARHHGSIPFHSIPYYSIPFLCSPGTTRSAGTSWRSRCPMS